MNTFGNSHSSWLQCQSNSSEPTCVVGASQVQRSVVTFPYHLHSDLITCNEDATFLPSTCSAFTNQMFPEEYIHEHFSTKLMWFQGNKVLFACMTDFVHSILSQYFYHRIGCLSCNCRQPAQCQKPFSYTLTHLLPVEPVHCRQPGLSQKLHCDCCQHQLCRSCCH